jgi:peptidoglycan/LPS O-acetylase OafA/YrhL
MALAVASAWLGANERRWRWSRFVIDQPGACWSAAIGVFVALCFTPVFKRTFIGGSHSMLTWGLEQLAYVVISALLLLPVVFGEEARGWPRRLLATRFLCFTGAVSYGVFLWHLPLLLWMSRAGWTKWIPGSPFLTLLLLTLLIALLFAWASYRLVELPAMRLRGEPPKRAT